MIICLLNHISNCTHCEIALASWGISCCCGEIERWGGRIWWINGSNRDVSLSGHHLLSLYRKGLKEGKCHTKEEGSDSSEVMPSLQDEYILQMPRISLLEVEDWWVI